MANSIDIRLQQPHFCPGDLIAGDVVITVAHPIEAHGVFLQVLGKEEAYWEEIKTHREDDGSIRNETVHFHGHEKFLKERLPLAGAGYLQPGTYSYSFAYNLPHHVPASFKEKVHPHGGLKVKGNVKYTLKAKVDAHHAKDFKTFAHISVGQRIEGHVAPVCHEDRKSFMFNQGHLAMKAEIDRSVYFPGDEVLIKWQIFNESVKKVNGINVELRRHVSLHADHHHHSLNGVVHHHRYEGVSEATKDTRLVRFQLPNHYHNLTTDTHHVKVSYEIKIECDVPMAVDLPLHMPIIITVPQPFQMAHNQGSSSVGESAEIDAMAAAGEDFHESSPLVLPENTGQLCACCVLY